MLIVGLEDTQMSSYRFFNAEVLVAAFAFVAHILV